MRRTTPLLLALALAVPLAAAVPAQAAQATERATAEQQAANLKLGTQLVDRFWSLIVAGDVDDLRPFLSPAFQVRLIRAKPFSVSGDTVSPFTVMTGVALALLV